MADWRDLGGGLQWRSDDNRADVRLGGTGAGLRFRREGGRRRSCALTFRDGAMAVDVSIQPAAIDRTCDAHARDLCIDPNRWRTALVRALKEWTAPDLDHLPVAGTSLLAAVGSVGHPLVGDALRRGALPLGEIPRWASPMLRSSSAGDAAAALAGPRSTRRLARALVGSIVPDVPGAEIGLGPLALAVIGAGHLTADDLAGLLEADVPRWPISALPTVDDVDVCRRALAHVVPHGRVTLLRDAATLDRPQEFVDVMRALAVLSRQLDGPVRGRLADVTAACRIHTAAMPTPTPPPMPGADHAVPAAEPRRRRDAGRARRVPARALVAPPSPTGHARHWVTPAALRPIDGHMSGDLRFVVPRSVNELTRWGQALGNCLADFASAVYWGRSWVIAVLRDDALIGCVEVDPVRRCIRQASGPRNAPLPGEVADEVHRTLRSTGITAESSRTAAR